MLSDAVRRAVDICDDGSAGLDDLLARFEDDDEPITAIDDVEARLNEALGPPDDWEPALTMARAVVVYLRYRRDQVDSDPAELLRLAARAEFDGEPPEPVARWLEARGVSEH
jgi:hypothetical protein